MCRRLLIVVLLAVPSSSSAAEPFALQPGETVVFFGDSITQSGGYVQYVEAYLRTRFPGRDFTLVNRGMNSQTISGTTEPDHDPPRPSAEPRFVRDVAGARPQVVVACFGMNDGNYHPFDLERFEKYQAGIGRLVRRSRTEAGARLVTLLSPPPFDPYRRKTLDPDAVSFGYKFIAIDYDATLTRYSDWLATLREEGLVVGDVHAASLAHLAARRKERVSFTLAPDGIHPNATGHWMIAQTLLRAWHAPAEVAELKLDGRTGKVLAGDAKDAVLANGVLSCRWTTPVPLPCDPDWDAKSIAQERVAERLNRYRLHATGLVEGRYRLRGDGVAAGEFTAAELGPGIDLTACPQFPTVRDATAVLPLVREKQVTTYAAWRAGVDGQQADPQAGEELAKRLREIEAELGRLCRVREVQIEIERLHEAGR